MSRPDKFRVNSDVPLPTHLGKYPFGEMKVGDSIFVPGREQGMRATKAAHTFGYTHGLKFTTRSTNEDGVMGVRIWRVA